MTKERLFFCFLGILSSFSCISCSLIAEAGPLKGQINKEPGSYRLVNVKTRADIPSASQSAGLAQVPPSIKGQGYSDKVRSRDTLHFIITDLSEQSPFFTRGDSYRYGPLEVPEDGVISMPYVGEIQVMNRSFSQISSDLADKIKPVSKTAQVAVVRSGRLSRTANVIGEVKTPGPVPLERSGLTSLDILAASGGPISSEHLFRYTLRRGGKEYQFDYLGFRRNPFIVEEGDLFTVTSDTANRFHVMGAINRPTSVPFPSPDPTLADALGAAAGFDELRSDPSGVFVFRKGNPEIVYTFDLNKAEIMPLVQRFPIKGEDIIYVTEAPLTRWNRLISQFLPSQVFQAAYLAERYSKP